MHLMENEMVYIKDRWHVFWEELFKTEQISEWENSFFFSFFFPGTFCVKLCFVKSDYVLLATKTKHMFQTDLISFQNDSPY